MLTRGPRRFNLIFAKQFKFPPNNNIDPVGQGFLNLMFANQFKRITQMKLRVFILKVANSVPHVTFL